MATKAAVPQLDLSRIVDTTKERIAKIEYDAIPGFFMKLRYIPRDRLRKILQKNTKWAFNQHTHVREEKVDTEEFAREFADIAVVDWEGLTVAGLRLLVPVDDLKLDGATEDSPVPYSKDNARLLIAATYDVDEFLREHCTNIRYFQSSTHGEELGNL